MRKKTVQFKALGGGTYQQLSNQRFFCMLKNKKTLGINTSVF